MLLFKILKEDHLKSVINLLKYCLLPTNSSTNRPSIAHPLLPTKSSIIHPCIAHPLLPTKSSTAIPVLPKLEHQLPWSSSRPSIPLSRTPSLHCQSLSRLNSGVLLHPSAPLPRSSPVRTLTKSEHTYQIVVVAPASVANGATSATTTLPALHSRERTAD